MLSLLNTWFFVPRRSAGVKCRLFCFPYAGGNGTVFRKWPEFLPPFVEVWALRLPGRETRLQESPHNNMNALLDDLERALIPFLDLPFAFFGHSMGTIVAFDLTRRFLAKQIVSPKHLFLSGRRAPQIPDPDPPIHDLPENEFWEEIRRLNGSPEEVLQHEELKALVGPTLRADFKLIETWRYQGGSMALPMPISIFGGSRDPKTSPAELQAWEVHTRSAFQLHMIEGDHFFLNNAQSELLSLIGRELNGVN
ncbi:MAG: thioesterase [Gammaproteobacteria bacterium]|nr:thioesterase [Gammaproteobacteria bacterium]